MTRSERLAQYALAARRRAAQRQQAAGAVYGMIPFGQPVRVGADRTRRDRAWANLGKAIAERERADHYEHSAARAAAYEARLAAAQAENLEGVSIGDEVIACWTNCGYAYRCRARILRRTVNDWVIELIDPPDGYAVGQRFKIPALGHPRSSARHRIYRLEDA